MRSKSLLVAAVAAVVAAFALAGCTETRRTTPERTANEQLLISTAADKAAEKLSFGYTAGSAVYLETAHFESYDKGYAISRIRTSLLTQGAHLVKKRKNAEIIVEISAGALSVNRQSLLFGLPSVELPVPTTDSVAFPEIAVFKQADRTGIAKFAAVATDAETGALVNSTGPVYGLSWLDRDKVLGIGWRDDNILPKGVPEDPPPTHVAPDDSESAPAVEPDGDDRDDSKPGPSR